MCNCSSDQQQRQEISERERRVTISISMAPPMPTYPSPRAHHRRQQRERHLTTVNIWSPVCTMPITGALIYRVISCRRSVDDSVSVCSGKDRERHRNSDNTSTGKHTPVCHTEPCLTRCTAWRSLMLAKWIHPCATLCLYFCLVKKKFTLKKKEYLLCNEYSLNIS